MPDYREMYFRMAACMADAVELLIEAQRQGEEGFMADQGHPLVCPLGAALPGEEKPAT